MSEGFDTSRALKLALARTAAGPLRSPLHLLSQLDSERVVDAIVEPGRVPVA